MPQKSPLARVKEAFGDKKQLVEAVKGLASDELWLGRTSADRGGSRGLAHVSNAKLLRLHQALSFAKDKFGTRAALIDAVLAAEGKSKDTGAKTRLERYPVPRLLDLYRSADRRAKRAARAEEPAKAAPAAAEKVEPVKATKAAKADKASGVKDVEAPKAPKTKAPKKAAK